MHLHVHINNFCLLQLGYAKQSVLAGAWFVATQTTSQHADVCLCGEGRVGQCMVRQWVEFYIARIRSETPWDSITNDQLKTVLEVRKTIVKLLLFQLAVIMYIIASWKWKSLLYPFPRDVLIYFTGAEQSLVLSYLSN